MKYPGLERQPVDEKTGGLLRQTARRFLRAQFGRPTGILGSLIGKIMARTPSNHERIQWTLSLLEIQPRDRILEIGFGPGFAIQRVCKLAPEGFVAGVDHSEVMVRQAGKLNASAIRAGRVRLRLGSATDLPRFDELFDRIFTINSIHFWPEPVQCLRSLHSQLRPGGCIAVTLQPRSRSATDDTARELGQEVADKLRQAGFSGVHLELLKMKPLAAACALGIKPE